MNEKGNIDLFRLGDLFPITLLVTLFIVYLSTLQSAPQARHYNLYYADSLVYTDSLRINTVVLNVTGNRVVLKSTDSTVQILESNCPEKICQHSQPIGHAGREIVCAPNRLVLKMVGEREDDVDIIAR